MTIEYDLEEQDYLTYQLFTASNSERIRKKKSNGRLYTTVLFLLAAIYFYFNHSTGLCIYFASVSLATFLLYPKYFKWRYKKHYSKHTKENHSKRFGLKVEIEINEEALCAKDKTGSSQINWSSIEGVDETSEHFFLRISTGPSIIIPKRDLGDPEALCKHFNDQGLSIVNAQNWKW